jgi:hypothetical protein
MTSYRNPNLVHIAVVQMSAVEHVIAMFEQAGIAADLPGGSRGCAVEVPTKDRARAVQLLREDSKTHSYWVGFPDDA